MYEPERKEKVSITASGLKGSITENYTVVPQYKGKYKIPSSSFSYFNPKDKKYYTISSEDLYVDVLEGKELPKVEDADTVVAKQIVKTTGKDFRFIQTTTSLSSSEKKNFINSTPFFVLLLLPFFAIPAAVIWKKKKEERDGDVVGNRLRKADRLAKKYLSEAQKELGNKEAFYESLERALHNYLKAKLGVETSDISKEKISDLLKEKSVNDNDIAEFTKVLNDCNFARYTPVTDTEMQQEFEKAKQVITQLDKQL